jgi:hypothetical protein
VKDDAIRRMGQSFTPDQLQKGLSTPVLLSASGADTDCEGWHDTSFPCLPPEGCDAHMLLTGQLGQAAAGRPISNVRSSGASR